MEHDSDIAIPTVLPETIPVMVLPDCHLFPGCLLPLYLFEERYRQMLAFALGTNRMFCIGNSLRDAEPGAISPFSTAGLVRCCIKQEDGTSHLLLLGLQRIKFTGWVQEKPFRIATIEALTTTIADAAEVERLKEKSLEILAASGLECAEQLREALVSHEDPELACDVLSYHLTRCPTLQQKLLKETSLERRYELLIQALEKQKCD